MSVKAKCPEFENHERWLVSFADMMTLLFALFVVLFALKKEGKPAPEVEQAAAAISEVFNQVLIDIPVDRRVGPKEAGMGIFESFRGNQARPPILKKLPSSETRIKPMDNSLDELVRKLEDIVADVNKAGKTAGMDNMSVHQSEEGIRIRLLATHFYEPGSYKMKISAEKELDRIAEMLKSLGRSVTIEGHTDASPMEGEMSNWDLSSLRATSVVRSFITRHNFSPLKVSAAGYADTRPIADNKSAAGRALNRRIEIVIHYDK